MPGKTATAKKLDENEEARVQALVDAVKLAPTLRALHQALAAMVKGGDLGEHAFRRINIRKLPTFGRSKRPGNDGTLSWDDEDALVFGEEGLEAARIVSREEAPKTGPTIVPKDREGTDESKAREKAPKPDGDAPANDGAEPAAAEASPELEPPSAEELTTAMRDHLAATRITVTDCKVTIRPSGVRFKIAGTYREAKVGGEWPWPAEAMSGSNRREFLEALADGLKEQG